MKPYIKIPAKKICEGTLINIVGDMAITEGKEYPKMPEMIENKFDIERIEDMRKCWGDKKRKKWKIIEQSLEYKEEEKRVKKLNDLRWNKYIDDLIEWLYENDYLIFEKD